MAEAKPRRFILQAIHPEYSCPAFEAMFEVERLEELREVLGSAAEDDPDLEYFYTLEPDDVAEISQRFGVGFDLQGRTACLYKWTSFFREVPYLVHTGYELPLMLDGRKQFARMFEEYPPMRHHHEEYFDPFVAQGLLHKEVDIQKFDEPIHSKGRVLEGIRRVYYTRKGEEWRISAWRLVEAASHKVGWNDTFERLEGMLFGYEDWQNDWWSEQLRQRKRQFGTLVVHLVVSASELVGIENTGYRALPPMNRTLHLVSDFEEDPDDKEPLRLMEGDGAVALVRLRAKVKAFLDLVGTKQDRFHQLPPDRIKDLNRLLVEDIEIVAKRSG